MWHPWRDGQTGVTAHMTDPAQAARQVLDAYFAAWNAADVEGMRRTFNYPFITLGPAGQAVIAAGPADFTTDFTRLREREGWHRSTLDSFAVIAASETKVHCRVGFSRYRPDDTRYATGTVLYIMTRHAGHWGLQLRSGLG